MSAVKIRTLSQLDSVSELIDGTLFGVSQPITAGNDSGYISQNVNYKTLKSEIEKDVEDDLKTIYNLQPTGSLKPINVGDLAEAVNKLSAEDCGIYGQKTFYTVPIIDADYSKVTVSDKMVPNVGYVQQLVTNNGDYLTDDMVVVGSPTRSARYTVFDRNFMHWKIGENQTDSSEYIDTTGYPVGPKVCTHTGNLVIYGWLADNGDVEPQDAWVGLYGCMHTSTDADNQRDWVLLQLQPWPLTTKSSVFQYVGFNVKVAKGLMLKIKTGFRVKGKNSGFQGGSSLTYWTNQPNSFVGYFITTADEYSAV